MRTKYPDKLLGLMPILFPLVSGVGFGGLLLSDRARPANPTLISPAIRGQGNKKAPSAGQGANHSSNS